MRYFWQKKIPVPQDERIQLTALETWTVRWNSTHSYTDNCAVYRKECEVFTDADSANKFANELREAAKLLKNATLKVDVQFNK